MLLGSMLPFMGREQQSRNLILIWNLVKVLPEVEERSMTKSSIYLNTLL